MLTYSVMHLFLCLMLVDCIAYTLGSTDIKQTAQIVQISPTVQYELLYIEAKDGKPTLLFLHGFPSSMHSWRHQMKYFSEKGYGCLIPNLLGYGQTYSPLNETEYSSQIIVGHLIMLLDRMKLSNSKVVVIGHDWGARTTSRFVLYHPERTLGVVLLSVAYSPPTRFNLTLALQQSVLVNGYESIGYWEFFEANDAATIIESNLDSFIDLIFAENSTLAKTDVAPRGKVRAWLSAKKRTNRAQYMTQQDYDTVRSYLSTRMQQKLNWFKAIIANVDWEYEKNMNATVQRPVLFIEGSRDYIGIVGAAAGQAKYIPDLKNISVDTGHWVMEEKPDDVNREIDQWLQRIVSSNSAASFHFCSTLLLLYFLLTI